MVRTKASSYRRIREFQRSLERSFYRRITKKKNSITGKVYSNLGT